jgi:hypothetical protein
MKPETLQQYAENLEKFDGAVRGVRGMQDLPPSQGNRISIFMLRDPAEVSRLAADKTGFTKGFYRGSAAGSLAFVSRSTPTKVQLGSWMPSRLGGGEVTYGIGTDTVLLHEYAHHLMMQAIDTPYPEWLVEGFAEFMSTAQFERDGSVGIGLPANHRYHALINGESLPLETILSGRYDKITVEQRESIYGRGWLLTHFLTFGRANSPPISGRWQGARTPSKRRVGRSAISASSIAISPTTSSAASSNISSSPGRPSPTRRSP